jgi:hypothetical protein
MAFILPTMDKRHKDYIPGRKSVLDEEQVNELKTDRFDHSARKRSRPFRKFIPLLAFAFIALMIAKEEIPAVSNAWERMIAPNKWLAKQTCQKAAIENVENKEFARILKPGKVNKTTDGLYIERLVIGEMGRTGNEISIKYSCYVDSAGKLVKLNRVEDASE